MVTTHQAKKIIKEVLDREGLPYTKLTGKTVDFTDLARSRCVFVLVHGWKMDPKAALLTAAASEHKFVVQFKGPGIVG